MKEKGYIMKNKNEYLVIYKSAWGKVGQKKIPAFGVYPKNLKSVVSKFEKIKPNATIQKIYLSNFMECGWASFELRGGY